MFEWIFPKIAPNSNSDAKKDFEKAECLVFLSILDIL